jgi:TolA-binding protein
VFLLLPGCFVTRSEGDRMLADLSELKTEVASLQRDRQDLRFLLENRMKEVNSRTSQLEKMSFKQNADTGLEKERLVTELQQLRGQLEETQHKLEEIKQAPPPKAGESEPVVQGEAPENKADHFMWAKRFYDTKQYDMAVSAFDSFLERFKDDKQFAMQAFFLRGDAYYMRAKAAGSETLRKDLYKKAVLSYQEVLTRFPSSSKAPESLYKVGMSLEAMGFGRDANAFYEEVVSKHPKSPFAADAKKRMSKLPAKSESKPAAKKAKKKKK